jgi:hypothetical protein
MVAVALVVWVPILVDQAPALMELLIPVAVVAGVAQITQLHTTVAPAVQVL